MSMAPTDEFPYVRGVGKEQDVYLGFSPLDFAQFQQVCGVKPHHLDPSNAFKDSTWKFPPLCPPYLRETRGACVLIGNDVVGILQERGVQDHYAAYRIGILGIVGPPDVTHFLTDREEPTAILAQHEMNDTYPTSPAIISIEAMLAAAMQTQLESFETQLDSHFGPAHGLVT